MRVKGTEFDAHLKKCLGKKSQLSSSIEAALFSQAEYLLAGRRSRLAAPKAPPKSEALRLLASRILDSVAFHPDYPATAAAFAALFVAYLVLPHGQGRSNQVSRSEVSTLPEFPKFNDFPAKYDAQRLAEERAYEREVNDAHEKTSGGT